MNASKTYPLVTTEGWGASGTLQDFGWRVGCGEDADIHQSQLFKKWVFTKFCDELTTHAK